jgi:hypothetical protein
VNSCAPEGKTVHAPEGKAVHAPTGKAIHAPAGKAIHAPTGWYWLFVLFLLAIVLSVLLRFTDSHYPFGIFRLFYNQMEGNIDRIHDDSLYWPGTDTSIKSGVVELVLRAVCQ